MSGPNYSAVVRTCPSGVYIGPIKLISLAYAFNLASLLEAIKAPPSPSSLVLKELGDARAG